MARFRRSFRRAPMPVIVSYKKVLNDAPATRVAATNIVLNIATGVDSITRGQTSPTDGNVPTGNIIKYIEIQWAYSNPVAGVVFLNTAIQKTQTGQLAIDPRLVGGNPQRNTIFHQTQRAIGLNQNGNAVFKFKVPKKFQRMKEGDTWRFSRIGNAAFTDSVQVIYKFYS